MNSEEFIKLAEGIDKTKVIEYLIYLAETLKTQ